MFASFQYRRTSGIKYDYRVFGNGRVDVFAEPVSGVISGLVNRIQPEDGNFASFTACAISGNWNDG
jgi:hypothetical protein